MSHKGRRTGADSERRVAAFATRIQAGDQSGKHWGWSKNDRNRVAEQRCEHIGRRGLSRWRYIRRGSSSEEEEGVTYRRYWRGTLIVWVMITVKYSEIVLLQRWRECDLWVSAHTGVNAKSTQKGGAKKNAQKSGCGLSTWITRRNEA